MPAARIQLPGRAEPCVVTAPAWAPRHAPAASRVVYAAPHVAARRNGDIDWESTIAFRDHLWDHGLGVADAMDTAQRGAGITWDVTRELIARSGRRAKERAARLAAGTGTDHLPAGQTYDLAAIRAAYRTQLDVVQGASAVPILMASRALAASGATPAAYVELYVSLIREAGEPVILHWLGEMFDPALRGYWGTSDIGKAVDTVMEIVAAAPYLVDGVKVSLLDPAPEIALRKRLPKGVRLYTGDDFNFASLIKGDETGHSDALLGIFSAVAAPTAHALAALDRGDLATYDAVMAPCEELGRKIFENPTSSYKAGIALVAWLNGFQPEFAMIDQFERRRPLSHYIEVFEIAAKAGALLRPEMAVGRMTSLIEMGDA